MNSGNETRAGSTRAIERATGRSWKAWVAMLERHRARELPHTEIARTARADMPADVTNPDWWAQSVAIAYEQHAGLRVPGQSAEGTFQVSTSRTLPTDRDAAIAAWRAGQADRPQQLGHAVSGGRASRTAKRTFWRFELADAGRVEVAAADAPGHDAAHGPKTVVTISHRGIPAHDMIESWRSHWKSSLLELSQDFA